MNRRDFLKNSTITTAALSLGLAGCDNRTNQPQELYKISLAQWSLNSLLFSGEMDNLEFPVVTKQHGIDGVEYVNQFFMDKAKDTNYLTELKNICDSEGVTSVLIMCDGEGNVADSDAGVRLQTVENHKKWVEAARFLGCHSIRVNAYSDVSWSADPEVANQVKDYAADGMRHLCEFADDFDINIIIENHGGFSSDANWLIDVMKLTDHPRAGTLPDFGNFRINRDEDNLVSFDSYDGTDLLMPYAKGVSLKPTVVDYHGNASPLDYERMMKIVLSHGYHGFVGIEHGERGRVWESIIEVRDTLLEAKNSLAG